MRRRFRGGPGGERIDRSSTTAIGPTKQLQTKSDLSNTVLTSKVSTTISAYRGTESTRATDRIIEAVKSVPPSYLTGDTKLGGWHREIIPRFSLVPGHCRSISS